MIHTLESTAPARPAARPGLLLHSSGEEAAREDVLAIPTPRSTYTWFPLPHKDLLCEVEGQLEAAGFTIEAEMHALSHGGARYFGVFQIAFRDRPESDHGWVVAIRNSHDKSIPAGLVAGSHVMVSTQPENQET